MCVCVCECVSLSGRACPVERPAVLVALQEEEHAAPHLRLGEPDHRPPPVIVQTSVAGKVGARRVDGVLLVAEDAHELLERLAAVDAAVSLTHRARRRGRGR